MGSGQTEGAEGVAIDQSGRVIAVGSTDTPADGIVFALACFGATGVPDQAFGMNGQVLTNIADGSQDRAHAVVVDRSNRIVVPGEVGHPRTWPLGHGPYRAGHRLVRGIPREHADAVRAIVYQPAAQEGENAPFAVGAPFPMIGYAHGNRNLGFTPCPGTPTDFSVDYQQLSTILMHLARWGYVSISTDQSATIDLFDRADILETSVSWLVTENARSGSPFKDRIRTAGIILVGHSTGGGAATQLAGTGSLDVAAVATLSPAGTASDAVAVHVPTLVELGSREGAEGGNGSPIYNAANPPKHFVFIKGANHFGYTDELCRLEAPAATIARKRSAAHRLRLPHGLPGALPPRSHVLRPLPLGCGEDRGLVRLRHHRRLVDLIDRRGCAQKIQGAQRNGDRARAVTSTRTMPSGNAPVSELTRERNGSFLS